MEDRREKAIARLFLLLFPFLLFARSPYQTGDLIFRSGKGIISDIAKNFSPTDKRFSHVGMLYIWENRAYVVHTLEDDAKKIKTTVQEPLRRFLDDATIWQVYQLPITQKERSRLEANIREEIALAKPFDYHFDLRTEDSYYCTELIWSLLRHSLGRDIIPTRTYKNRQPFLAIEDILHISDLRPYR